MKNLVNWFIYDMNFLLLCYNCCNHITVIRCNDGTNIIDSVVRLKDLVRWRYIAQMADPSVFCLDMEQTDNS